MSDWSLISESTASGAANVSFTDLTGYKIFKFVVIDLHPSDATNFLFQGSTNSGSSYGVTMTSTFFNAAHNEGDTTAELVYETGSDLAQSTSFQRLLKAMDNESDSSGCGELFLFNPASTTYAKHWYWRANGLQDGTTNYSADMFAAGYFNDGANAIDALQFKMSSGTFDGTIKQYGLVAS